MYSDWPVHSCLRGDAASRAANSNNNQDQRSFTGRTWLSTLWFSEYSLCSGITHMAWGGERKETCKMQAKHKIRSQACVLVIPSLFFVFNFTRLNLNSSIFSIGIIEANFTLCTSILKMWVKELSQSSQMVIYVIMYLLTTLFTSTGFHSWQLQNLQS